MIKPTHIGALIGLAIPALVAFGMTGESLEAQITRIESQACLKDSIKRFPNAPRHELAAECDDLAADFVADLAAGRPAHAPYIRTLAKSWTIVECDTDSDCAEKNPGLEF